MRLPTDLPGRDLARLLCRHFDFEVVRHTGSHVRPHTQRRGRQKVTIPAGGPLQVGTLAAILAEVAGHHGIGRDTLDACLFGT